MRWQDEVCYLSLVAYYPRGIHAIHSVELSCLLSRPASIMHDITWRAYGGPSLRVAQVTGNAIVSFFKQVVG